jgi:hypothetical protein
VESGKDLRISESDSISTDLVEHGGSAKWPVAIRQRYHQTKLTPAQLQSILRGFSEFDGVPKMCRTFRIAEIMLHYTEGHLTYALVKSREPLSAQQAFAGSSRQGMLAGTLEEMRFDDFDRRSIMTFHAQLGNIVQRVTKSSGSHKSLNGCEAVHRLSSRLADDRLS